MAPDAPTTATRTGTVLSDRYELGRLIARGGMADVFEAHDQLLDRRVAVKVFRAAEAAHRERFDAEVRLLASLNHPGLVPVYDAGEHAGDGFMVLELVEGPTLRSTLGDRAPLPGAEVAALGATLADALAHVHDRGIVHRDLTPANVLCGPDGAPRLTDFGIARLLDTTRVTAEHLAIGTVGYMAPEQVEGTDVTPAADVYALGLVLLEALTGAPAFSGPSHEVAIARLTRDPAVPDELPEPWPGLLRAMTARRPEDRPSAASVAASLRSSDRLAGPGAAASVAASPWSPTGSEPAAPSDSSTGGSIVVPAGVGSDPEAATVALPVSETGPAPTGVADGQGPTKTTVMPATRLPTPPAPEAPGGDPDGRPATSGDHAAGHPSGAGAPLVAALSAGAAGIGETIGAAGDRLQRRARGLTFHQWVAVAAAVVFVFAVWQSGGGDWTAQLAAARASVEGDAAEVPPSTTEAPTTTTVAPAPPPPPPEQGLDEGRGNGSEGRDDGKGKGKKGKGDDEDDDD